MMDWLYLSIVFEIHAISCPGVWICQSGPVRLTIRSLGYVYSTQPVPPRFPIILHELFTMEGYFKDVHSQLDLSRKLSSEVIEMSLYQNGHRLAFFRETLANVLAHQQSCKSILDVEFLMNRTKCFPGIIAPKVESRIDFSLRRYNPETDCLQKLRKGSVCSGNLNANQHRFHKQNHNRASIIAEENNSNFKRQKTVCHNQVWSPDSNTNFFPTNIMRSSADNNRSCLKRDKTAKTEIFND